MTIVSSREQYLEAGLEVLADLGYSGLKLGEVCRRLGVTTGSFYHRFSGWQQYAAELGRYWMDTQADQLVDRLWAEPDPRRRLERLAEMMLGVSHRTEAAIRSWAAIDPEVRALLTAVDEDRLQIITGVIAGVLPDQARAHLLASWSVYLLAGYQAALIPYDFDALTWAIGRIVELAGSEPVAPMPGG